MIDTVGNELHKRLVKDYQVSYPGANGVSFAEHDLESDPDVKRLLHDATAEGFLLQREHTPKTLSRGKSIKWYTQPRIYHPDYSRGIAKYNGVDSVTAYCLRLGGRDLYCFPEGGGSGGLCP